MDKTVLLLCGIMGIVFLAETALLIFDMSVMKKKRKNNMLPYIIIPVFAGMNCLEYLVREVIWRYRKAECLSREIVLLNMGADEEILTICRKLCQDNRSVVICSKKELQKKLQNSE